MPRGVYVRTSEIRKAMSDAHKGKSWGHHSEESKRKIGEANRIALTGRKGNHLSEATKKKISESNRKTQKEKWAKIPKDEKYKILENWMKAGCAKNQDTSIEVAVQNELKLLGVEFEKQKHIGPYFIDIFIPAKSVAIECDGDYWHSFEDRKEKDKMRDEWLEEQGIIVIRLPEHAIRNDVKGLVKYVVKLLKFIKPMYKFT